MAQQKVQSIDPAQSRFGFEIKTRFGTKIEGFFPRFRGDVVTLADGRQQVRFRLDATQVEIPGKDRYTSWMRGEDFSTLRSTRSSNSSRCRMSTKW